MTTYYRRQTIPKNFRRPAWDAKKWSIHVVDGNGIEWMLHFVDGVYMETMLHDETTPEIARDIIKALEHAMKSDDLKAASTRSPSKTIPFPKKPRSKTKHNSWDDVV